MRIKELQLYGFKSFPHKTAIRFSTGINAIIGPNGCGKSNVLDALRWVLGEQSFSTLRCGKNEDVIFSGTAQIPALGYAEVRLILDNDGQIPSLGSEVEIRRRYYRSGESEYYLNRTQCRLKDIQDVFFDSGTGTKAYSIFDLRSLRSIISGELRPMLEEVATLARYRQRRSDCLRKLELTDNDLVRVNDIITERERITRSLKRQAYRLSAYNRLKTEEKRLRMLMLLEQYRIALDQEKQAAQARTASEQADADALGRLRQAEEELESLHRQLSTSREQREQAILGAEELRTRLLGNENQRAVAQSDIKRWDAEDIQLKAELAALGARLTDKQQANLQREQKLQELVAHEQTLTAELEDKRGATRASESRLLEIRKTLAADKETIRQQLETRVQLQRTGLALEAGIANSEEYNVRLSAEVQVLETRAEQSRSELETRAREQGEATAALEQAQARLVEQRGRQDQLARQRAESEQNGQRLHDELLTARQELALLASIQDEPRRKALAGTLGGNLLGSVADFITVPDGFESAVEAALYGILDFFVVRDAGLAGAGQLDRAARWGFILDARTAAGQSGPISGSLAEKVQFKDNAPVVLKSMLGRTLLVDSLEDALAHNQKEPAVSCVTRDGIALFPDGVVVLESRQGRLSVERRARDLTSRAGELDTQVKANSTERLELNRQLAVLEQEIGSGDTALMQLVNTRSALDATHNALKQNHTELAAELNRQRSELHSVQSRLNEMRAKLGETGGQLKELEAVIGRTEQGIAEQEQTITGLEQDVKTGLDQASRVLLSLTQLREQINSRRSEFELYRQDYGRDEERRAEIARRQEEIKRLTQERGTAITGLAGDDLKLRDELTAMERRLAELDLGVLTRREEELTRNLHEQRQTQETLRQQALDLKLKALEATHRRTEFEQEAERSFNTHLAEFSAEPEPDVANKLRLISERLDRLGRVNPLAGDEYDKEKQELDRLTTQRADVLAAKDNLLKTIAEIDRHAREQFVGTFDVVRDAFREIFARLFVEGEADLILETPADPLESEITIIAKPRGKSPKRLDQLSDGEKALLALSLLFAFYKVKPAPFCFLDEVDAPLDDANVDRFALFLKELSDKTQVLIITHNRATVEQANVLFGVTTEGPGVSKIVSVKFADLEARQAAGISN